MTRHATIPPSGPLAVALDELLCDPAAAELLTRVRKAMPVSFRDQTDAAAGAVLRGMQQLAEREGTGPPSLRTPAGVPPWLRLNLLTAMVAWVTGEARTCLHAPHWSRPEPMFASAWRPDVVACAACCPHLHKLPRGSAADRTCDACGRVTAAPDVGGGIASGALACGDFVLLYGTCRDCTPDTAGTTS